MNKPSTEYWGKRFELLTELLLNKADRHYIELIKEYEKALLRIQREIEVLYSKFAIDNQITLQEARKLLNNRELEEFHWTIKEYVEKAMESSINEAWINELKNASIRVRISRLESLEYQIRQQIELLHAKRLKGLTELVQEITEEGYYRTIYEIQKGFGIGDTFGILDTKVIESIITKPWAPDGSNFSSRIWRDKELLMNELKKSLIQSFIRGDAPDKAIKHIADTMNVSKKAAGRLIMTESAFFANEAREKAFRELDVEEYIFIATLDIKTSKVCREMDSKVFKLSEKQVGVNWPPLHPNCRSTTAPYFEGNIKERWAREPITGKGYMVPNMSYDEWYEKYVSSNPDAVLAEKKWKNRQTDMKQYTKYKEVLGKDLGVNSIDEFQNLKYNDVEGWKLTKYNYKLQNSVQTQNSSPLRNYEKLYVANEKYTGYLFNPNNAQGYAKGKAFKSRLGYDINNYKELDKLIKSEIGKYPAIYKGNTIYGEKFEVNMVLRGLTNKQAKVKVGIMIEKDTNIPKVTTMFVDKLKESD